MKQLHTATPKKSVKTSSNNTGAVFSKKQPIAIASANRHSSYSHEKDKALKEKRYNLCVYVHSNSDKDALIGKLKTSISFGLSRKHVTLGTNSVMKLIELRKASVVCISRDTITTAVTSTSRYPLHAHIIEACRTNTIPYVILPKLSSDISSLFNVKSVSCFAIPTADHFNSLCSDSDSHLEAIHASVDTLRDTIIEFYTSKVLE